MNDNDCKRAARAYVEDLGWPVIVLDGKSPEWLGKGAYENATTDLNKVEGWFKRKPRGNVGLVPCFADLITIDVDKKHGGLDTQREIEAALGPFPETTWERTGGGGAHYLYGANGHGDFRLRHVQGIEVRYKSVLVVDPSVHPDTGEPYEWQISPFAQRPTEFDLAYFEEVQAKFGKVALFEEGDEDWTIPIGERSTALTSLAGSFRTLGLNGREIEACLNVVSDRCESGQEREPIEQHIAKIAAGATQWKPGKVPWKYRFPNARAPEEHDPPSSFPTEGLYGVIGDWVKAREPHTEAPRAFLYSAALAFAAAYLGPKPHFYIGATKHGCALYALNIGETAKARKGTAEDEARFLFSCVDEDFMRKGGPVFAGATSGEGLGDKLDTRVEQDSEHSYKIEFAGQRFLNVESEFSRVLKVASRHGNPLEEAYCKLWDDGSMASQTRNKPILIEGAHFCLLASTTKSALDDYFLNAAASRGFGNRLLYVYGKRSHLIAHPRPISAEEVEPFAERIRLARMFAESSDQYQMWDEDAYSYWEEIYKELDEADDVGLVGEVLHRSGAIIRRLALLFAVLDLKAMWSRQHLDAAYAFWKYTRETALYLFGNSLGDATLDKAYKAFLASPAGLAKNDLIDVFSRNKRSAEVDHIIARLEGISLIVELERAKASKGRPERRWIATKYR
jgi:hypothetical protein